MGVCDCSMFCCTLLLSILVLQSSWWGRESWLLCLICLPGVSWWLSGSSSRCHGGCLRFVIVVFPDHIHVLFSVWKTVSEYDQAIPQSQTNLKLASMPNKQPERCWTPTARSESPRRFGEDLADEFPSIKVHTVIRTPPQRKKVLQTSYALHGHTLEVTEASKYFCITISEDLTWDRHIHQVAWKGNNTPGFLRRNFNDCTIPVKKSNIHSNALPINGICINSLGPG